MDCSRHPHHPQTTATHTAAPPPCNVHTRQSSDYFGWVLIVLLLIAGFDELFNTIDLVFTASYATPPEMMAVAIVVAEIAFAL